MKKQILFFVFSLSFLSANPSPIPLLHGSEDLLKKEDSLPTPEKKKRTRIKFQLCGGEVALPNRKEPSMESR